MALETLKALNWSLISLIASIILAVIIIMLYIIQRKIQNKAEHIQGDRNVSYRRRLKRISKKINTRKTISEINKLAREYFKEAFGIDPLLDYSEIKSQLKDKKECVEFCELMLSAKYSGKKIGKNQVKSLIMLLDNIIKNNSIKIIEKNKF